MPANLVYTHKCNAYIINKFSIIIPKHCINEADKDGVIPEYRFPDGSIAPNHIGTLSVFENLENKNPIKFQVVRQAASDIDLKLLILNDKINLPGDLVMLSSNQPLFNKEESLLKFHRITKQYDLNRLEGKAVFYGWKHIRMFNDMQALDGQQIRIETNKNDLKFKHEKPGRLIDREDLIQTKVRGNSGMCGGLLTIEDSDNLGVKTSNIIGITITAENENRSPEGNVFGDLTFYALNEEHVQELNEAITDSYTRFKCNG